MIQYVRKKQEMPNHNNARNEEGENTGSMKNVDVVALGDLILNMVYRGKTEAGFNLYERQPAGATGNLLSQIVRLGGTGALITTVGDDDHGKFLYEYAKESGIDVSGVVISDKVETRMMFVHFDEKKRGNAPLRSSTYPKIQTDFRPCLGM